MKYGRDEIEQKRLQIANWFEDASIDQGAVELLREWKGSRAFHKLTREQFARVILQSRGPVQIKDKTARWISEFQRYIAQAPDNPERMAFEAALQVPHIVAPSRQQLAPPEAPTATTTAQSIGNADDLCQIALSKARWGLHFSAWSSLKVEFQHYARRDAESAMRIAPTLIYLAYRYFSIERISETARIILDAWSEGNLSSCHDSLKTLCLVQLATALSEHGQGALAGKVLEKNLIESLLRSRTEVPWPKVQIMRTMATYFALHDPESKDKVFHWLSGVEELTADPSNERACAAVRYTIHMRRRNSLDLAFGAIEPHYESSRRLLIEAINNPRAGVNELRQVCNDVYLGAIAQSVMGDYDARRQKEDIKLLRWGLESDMGVTRQEMDDDVMGIQNDKLSVGLLNIRKNVLRRHFVSNSLTLSNVIRLIQVLRKSW